MERWQPAIHQHLLLEPGQIHHRFFPYNKTPGYISTRIYIYKKKKSSHSW